jgi:hypothetical protein
LVIYSIPTRGFTAALSVFRAHLPPSPSIVKSGLIVSALVLAIGGHTTPVERARSFLAQFGFAPGDIIPMSAFLYSQFDPFVCLI